MIQRECTMKLLIDVCPSFRGKWEEHLRDIWDRDSELILYTDFAEFARHLTSLAASESFQELEAVFNEIEYLLQQGDPFVQEAVMVGLLEDFQNGLLNIGYEINLIEKYFKPETKKYWTSLTKFWNGEIPYIDNNQ